MRDHGWQPVADDDTVRVSPGWFRLVDDFTRRGPLARVAVELDRRDPLDTAWIPVDTPVTVTTAGNVGFPGLERRRGVAGLPAKRYRVRAQSAFYVPLYRDSGDGIEFSSLPDDPAGPPQQVVRQDIVLLPAVRYPYAAYISVVRGQVRDAAGAAVADVVVSTTAQAGAGTRTDRTLTDERGTFALALRWIGPAGTATVTALDRRTQRTATVQVTLPAGLSHSQLIIIV
ncbi:hypothetical protein ACIBQ1_03600 [Nonomuraea sp. NPDC050153]|uniref:hypothetical protein n=1 Tax=Nonomuraea sp. NPDC050153 TaxID=3364359 RepID=UPI00379274E0